MKTLKILKIDWKNLSHYRDIVFGEDGEFIANRVERVCMPVYRRTLPRTAVTDVWHVDVTRMQPTAFDDLYNQFRLSRAILRHSIKQYLGERYYQSHVISRDLDISDFRRVRIMVTWEPGHVYSRKRTR